MEVLQSTTQTSERMSTFEELIAPLSVEAFVERYWEQETLILKRKNSTYFQELLSMEVLDQILDLPQIGEDNFRVVNQEELVSRNRFLNKDGSVNLNKLYTLYADGFSISLRSIDAHWMPIKRLCFNLRKVMSHHVKTNMYLTPKNAAAFNPHIDAHDVIILQIEGTKHWKLYDTLFETPLLDSPTPKLTPDQLHNVQEVTLNAGDFMYLPRGVPHEAYTTDSSSLHLTIGVYPVQWVDVLSKAIRMQAYEDVRLRKALPFGYLNNRDKAEEYHSCLQEYLDSSLNGMKERLHYRKLHTVYSLEFRNKLSPLGKGHFSQIDQIDQLSLDTVLKKREGVECSVQVLGSLCRIVYNRNVIKGPVHIINAMRFVAESEQAFTLRELPVHKDEHKLALAAKMIRGGLLVMEH